MESIKILVYPSFKTISMDEFLNPYMPPKGYAFTRSYDNGFSYCGSDPIEDPIRFKAQVAELAANAETLRDGEYLSGSARLMNYNGERVIRVDVFVARHTCEISFT